MLDDETILFIFLQQIMYTLTAYSTNYNFYLLVCFYSHFLNFARYLKPKVGAHGWVMCYLVSRYHGPPLQLLKAAQVQGLPGV